MDYTAILNKLSKTVVEEIKTPVGARSLYERLIALNGTTAVIDMQEIIDDVDDRTSFNKVMNYIQSEILREKCIERYTQESAALGAVLTSPHMNLLWNTVNCEGDATAFLLHGVSYLDEAFDYFTVPDNVVYIQSVRVGLNLSSVADSVILDLMRDRTKYIKTWLATGSTGKVEIDYLLAECIIYFPGDRIPIRYLFGKPADNSGPPISTYYYKKDSTVVDNTKFRYMIMQLNNIAPHGTGKYFMTNKSIIDAIVARASGKDDPDYAEHKFHLVFVAACSSVRSSIMTGDGAVSKIQNCLVVYQEILAMEKEQMKKILQLLSVIFAQQYEQKRSDLNISKEQFYVPDIKVPNIDFDTETGSTPKPWAVFGFGLYFDTLRFSHSDNVPKTIEGILSARVSRGSMVSDNAGIHWAEANSRKAQGKAFRRSPSLASGSVDPKEETRRAEEAVQQANDIILRNWLHIKLKGPGDAPFTIYLQPKTGSIAEDNSSMDKTIGIVGEGREEKYVGGAGGAGGASRAASGGGSSSAPTYGGALLRKRRRTHYKHKRATKKHTRRAPRKHGR